ncbi:MAG: hypothetical protein WCF90_00545 [Methanomicrobiales archaeon]
MHASSPLARLHKKCWQAGAQRGKSSARSRGYYLPGPPVGTTHRFVFRLYAIEGDIS